MGSSPIPILLTHGSLAGGQCWPSPQLLTAHLLVFCYLSVDDHSRVRLLVLDGDPHSDYINANYIDVRVSTGLGGGALGLVVAGSRPMAVPQPLPQQGGPPRTCPEGSGPSLIYVISVTRIDYPSEAVSFLELAGVARSVGPQDSCLSCSFTH